MNFDVKFNIKKSYIFYHWWNNAEWHKFFYYIIVKKSRFFPQMLFAIKWKNTKEILDGSLVQSNCEKGNDKICTG